MTRSIATWYGMIRCESAEISRPEVSTPRRSSPAFSSISASGFTTTPLPITFFTPGDRIPDGMSFSAKSRPSGVTTVCPALLPPW